MNSDVVTRNKKKLEQYNDIFMEDAINYKYIIMNEENKPIFSKTKPKDFSIHTHQIIRNIRYNNPKKYMLVLDFDSKAGFNKYILQVLRIAYNYFDIKPLFKFSGKKGAQIIFDVVFDEEVPDNIARTRLLNIAYNFYIDSKISKFLCGNKLCEVSFTKKKNEEKIINLDLHMYDKNRNIRGFTLRESGYYSIPINPLHELKDIRKQAQLKQELVPFNGLYQYEYNPEKINLEYKEEVKEYYNGNNVVKRAGVRKGVDAVPQWAYECLYNSAAGHDCRFNIVTYLYNQLGWGEDIILKFILSHAKWSDYNYGHIKYQVYDICGKYPTRKELLI